MKWGKLFLSLMLARRAMLIVNAALALAESCNRRNCHQNSSGLFKQVDGHGKTSNG